MSTAADVKAIVAKLNDSVASNDTDAAIVSLKKLRDDTKATEELLRETRAGVAVGKLRTHASTEIASLAKAIVKVWKEVVEESKKRKASDDGAPSGSSKKRSKGEKSELSSATGSPAGSPAGRAVASLPSSSKLALTSSSFASIIEPYPEKPRTFKGDKPAAPGLGDDVRDKCIELVYDALAGDSNVSKDILLEKSKSVEKGFFLVCESKTDNSYRQKMRGICLNLKDKANPGLRDQVVRGELPGSQLAKMSKEDLASSSLQALNKKLDTENLFNSRAADQIAAETDQFKCGKCALRRTTYYQMQTRSADEPMTTFVTCLNCNNRWKFS